MPTLRLRLCAYTVLMIFALAFSSQSPIIAQTPQATAEATSTSNPLLSMLALVPQQPDLQTDLMPFSYADYRAAEAALNVAKPASSAAFAALSKDDQAKWFRAADRLRATPSSLIEFLTDEMKKMPSLVGFDWFDIDRAVGYGTAPHDGILLNGTFDSNSISKALSARQFQKTDIQGITVWTRFDDGQLNIQAVDPGDPFGGSLGKAARIALLPGGYIADSAFTGDITQVIATSNHTQKSVIDAPDVRALADAISDSQTYHGSLVQAIFITPALADKLDFKNTAKIPSQPDLSKYAAIPAYSFAVIADRQEDQMQVSIVALAYTDQVSAQTASAELENRLNGLDVGQIYETTNAKIEQGYVYQDENGQFVALVAVRYPLPSDKPDAATGSPTQPGLVFVRWTQMLDLLQFYPLAIKVPEK